MDLGKTTQAGLDALRECLASSALTEQTYKGFTIIASYKPALSSASAANE